MGLADDSKKSFQSNRAMLNNRRSLKEIYSIFSPQNKNGSVSTSDGFPVASKQQLAQFNQKLKRYNVNNRIISFNLLAIISLVIGYAFYSLLTHPF